jgi:hypothetical protein
MKFSSVILLTAALVPVPAAAAEYHIYKSSSGSAVLSNLPAAERPADRAPGSLTVVKSYSWADTTAEEIAATEKENRESARISALRDLAAQVERLAEEMQRSNEITLDIWRLRALQPATEINQVIVSQGRFGRFRSRW